MSPTKAPSAGTKVDLGQNAPTKREAAGAVVSDSLAAESYREGGAFASNIGSQPENLQSSDLKNSGSRDPEAAFGAEYREGLPGTVSENSASSGHYKNNAQEAPSYVNNQYTRDPHGPHGKNLQEGFDDSGTQDGIKAAMNAEIGSKNDPSRQAEYQFKMRNNAVPQAANEGTLATETKYDGLGSNVSA